MKSRIVTTLFLLVSIFMLSSAKTTVSSSTLRGQGKGEAGNNINNERRRHLCTKGSGKGCRRRDVDVDEVVSHAPLSDAPSESASMTVAPTASRPEPPTYGKRNASIEGYPASDASGVHHRLATAANINYHNANSDYDYDGFDFDSVDDIDIVKSGGVSRGRSRSKAGSTKFRSPTPYRE